MFVNLAQIVADFGKAATQAAAAKHQAKNRPAAAECTPCAANAYIQQQRRELSGAPSGGGKKRRR